MSRPFVRLLWAMGDVRAPSTELRRRFWTSTRTKGGTWASAAEVRSQLSVSQSISWWTAQSMGADPSSGAATATQGVNAMPTRAPDTRSARMEFLLYVLLHRVAAALEARGHSIAHR